MFIIDSYSPEKTKEIATKLGRLVFKGDVICLTGDLGAGKTAFSSGLGKGLDIGEPIVSPTYTIVHEYHEGRMPLYHFDVYRIEHIEEMYDIGYQEYVYGDGVSVIEWANLIEEIIPKDNLWIDIRRGDQENHRKIYLKAHGERYQTLVKELTKDEDISH